MKECEMNDCEDRMKRFMRCLVISGNTCLFLLLGAWLVGPAVITGNWLPLILTGSMFGLVLGLPLLIALVLCRRPRDPALPLDGSQEPEKTSCKVIVVCDNPAQREAVAASVADLPHRLVDVPPDWHLGAKRADYDGPLP